MPIVKIEEGRLRKEWKKEDEDLDRAGWKVIWSSEPKEVIPERRLVVLLLDTYALEEEIVENLRSEFEFGEIEIVKEEKIGNFLFLILNLKEFQTNLKGIEEILVGYKDTNGLGYSIYKMPKKY